MKPITAIALAAAGLVAASCAPMRVRSFAEPGIDLTRYHTYAWSVEANATGDPRLDNNPFFHERLVAAADRELVHLGFEKDTVGTPDVFVHYHARITQEVDINAADQRYGTCHSCGASVYDAGSILIDFVDARSEKLAWRGWAETSMQGSIDNQRWMEEQIDQAVVKILQKLPARAAN